MDGKYSTVSVSAQAGYYNQELFVKALVTRPFEEFFGEIDIVASGPRRRHYNTNADENTKRRREQEYIDGCEKHGIVPFSHAKLKLFTNTYRTGHDDTWFHTGSTYLDKAYARKVEKLIDQGGKISSKTFNVSQDKHDFLISDALPRHFALGYEVTKANLTLMPNVRRHYQIMEKPFAKTELQFNEDDGLELTLGVILDANERKMLMGWFNDLVLHNFHEKISNYNHMRALERK